MCTEQIVPINSTLKNDYELLRLFIEFFYKSSDNKYNSSRLRKLVNKTNPPCINIKTFNNGIKELNKKMEYYSHPPGSQSSFHPITFYRRLFYCLNLTGEEFKEVKEETDSFKSRKKIRSMVMPADSDCPHNYIFDIHKLYMPPFFAPLFVGIVGSIKKANNWKNFRECALEISKIFYQGNLTEFNNFIPDNEKLRTDLYTYWLELHFSDELFDFIKECKMFLKKNHNFTHSYNLSILMPIFYKINFLTRAGQKEFIDHMNNVLEQCKNTPPMVLQTNELAYFNFEPSELDKEFTTKIIAKRDAIQDSERTCLQNMCTVSEKNE